MKNKIGIVVIATNAYFVLGIKFLKRFMHFYNGNSIIKFYFFSDQDPSDYLPDNFPVVYIQTNHSCWADGTNSKFTNILSLDSQDLDYIYYFDADTSVDKNFDETWFLGDLVGGEHYANASWMKETKGFDRNPQSKAYIPHDTKLPQLYYYGAFFGGSKTKMLDFCRTLKSWQHEDKKIPYEPCVNDESYINAYFHYNPPSKTVSIKDFAFVISDKSGIGQTRDTNLDMTNLKKNMLQYKNSVYNIQNGSITNIIKGSS